MDDYIFFASMTIALIGFWGVGFSLGQLTAHKRSRADLAAMWDQWTEEYMRRKQ